MKKEQLPEYLKPAYDIFVKELSQHLTEMKQISLERLSDSECRASISRRFHTIKGGAGFLSLNEIADCSDDAEKSFKSDLALEDYEKKLFQALSILEQEHLKL